MVSEKITDKVYRDKVTERWKCSCGKIVHEGENRYWMQVYSMSICGRCAFKLNGYTNYKG